MRTLYRTAVVLAVGILLAGCGSQESSDATGTPAASPADPKLARLYDQTCRACHTNPASGAPQTGDRKAWDARMAQGMDLLLEHTLNGYRGMPPLGSCMDCSEAEFEALIRFMAGDEKTGS